jgi:hypothetical protein
MSLAGPEVQAGISERSARHTLAQSSTTSFQYQPDGNTLGLWHMNEISGSTVADTSGNSNNGTAVGTSIVTGKFGRARSFSGSGQYIDLPENAPLLSPGNYLTLEAWINIPAYPASGQGNHIISTGNQNDYDLSIYSDGRLSCALYLSTGPGTMFGRSAVPLNQWVHVAVTYDGATVRFYINGIQDTSFARTGTVGGSPQAENIAIGAYLYNGSFTQFFQGTMDEVRVSNKARAATEFGLQLPPQNVAGLAGATSASLTWDNGGGNVPLMIYRVYRGADSTSMVAIDSTASTQYSDSGLLSGHSYFYRISAVDSSGFEGARSTAVRVSIAPNPASGLVAYYPFSGNASDASGNGNDGTVNGATLTTDRFGNAGMAYSFNGTNNSIVIPASSSLDFTGTRQFAFSCWINSTSYNHQMIGFKGAALDTPYPNEWAVVIEPDKTLRFKVNADASNLTYSYLTTSASLQINTWSHVVAMWDGIGGTMKFYLNGSLIGSISAISHIVSLSTQPLYIGYVGDGPFGGAIDDIRIYDRTLSDSEIAALYAENNPLPIQLASFTAVRVEDKVQLTWKTVSEVNNYGFDIQRKSAAADWSRIGFVPGHGTTLDPQTYTFQDDAPSERCEYRLRQIDRNGAVRYYDPISVATGVSIAATPGQFKLEQNYPNPFNPTTTIAYVVPEVVGGRTYEVGGKIRLAVYDLLGREVAVLVDGVQSPGRHEVVFDARNLASGVYVYRLTAGAFSATRKLTIVR